MKGRKPKSRSGGQAMQSICNGHAEPVNGSITPCSKTLSRLQIPRTASIGLLRVEFSSEAKRSRPCTVDKGMSGAGMDQPLNGGIVDVFDEIIDAPKFIAMM
jgi:hypothetical protein